MAKASESKLKYIRKWKEENVRTFKFECNRREDADVIAFLDEITRDGGSKAAVIKAALREFMRID